ncbi:MAG: DUF6176 family protein [Actinomycetota bacterium]|nr:DUF6176 family protein [Actinomycetota bacterium]
MLRVAFRKIAPDKIEKIRSWMAEAQQRDDEVRATFRQETVRHEQAYLLQSGGEHILVYAMEAEDPEAARRAFENSTLKIDHEHRQVLAEVVEETLEPELLYDVRL